MSLGPPNGSGPRSERKLRAAREHSHSRSDARRASPTSRSSLPTLTASIILLAGTALTVVLIARGRSRFDALFDGVQIVKARKNRIFDAARILHRHGYLDDCFLIARHEGADHDATHGPL